MEKESQISKGFNRKHLIIMALGNIIGSGIFLGSGVVLSIAGPAAILAYIIAGIIMVMEVMFIAEMSIINPAPGSFRVHASEIFGPGMGFINGWMFWCSGVLGMASEVTAAAIFTSIWFTTIPLWVFCLIYSALMTIINLNDVKGLSKIESYLASIKVITLIAFILFGIGVSLKILNIGVNVSLESFKTLQNFMPYGIKGIFAAMIMVLFSYTGTGIIGLAIADTNNPEKDVPPAIYTISLTVIILYVLSMFFIIALIPWNSISAQQSPFIRIMEYVGIPFGEAVLTFIVLTAALSGLNSAMYSASRMLYSLSRDNQAPAIFMIENKNGVPVYALGVSSLVLSLTAILSYALPEKVFIILIGASGFTAMINWITISITHYFYRKKTLKECPEKLKYKVPGYPLVTIIAILLISGVFATSPLYPGQIASLITGVGLLIFISIVYLAYKSLRKQM